MIAYLYQYNHLKKDNLLLVENHHTQINVKDHSIDHEYHHKSIIYDILLE